MAIEYDDWPYSLVGSPNVSLEPYPDSPEIGWVGFIPPASVCAKMRKAQKDDEQYLLRAAACLDAEC